jgi:hypothetical protein
MVANDGLRIFRPRLIAWRAAALLAVTCLTVGQLWAKPAKQPPVHGFQVQSVALGQTVQPVDRTNSRDWFAVMGDDFESGFPGSQWTLQHPGSGPDWGSWTCWSSSGTRSAGCAAGGSGAISCGQNYPDQMESWMTAGPFNLSDPTITAGVLQCMLNLNCEVEWDSFFMLVSIDGSSFNGVQYWGSGTQLVQLDLANVYNLGNVLGYSQVWVRFAFVSDGSINLANGAQIDDVLLAVEMPAANQTPVVSLTSPDGGETWAAGSTQAITYTASDPDSGPSALSIALDYSTNSGGTWTAIATGLSNTGSFSWTLPDLASTTARVRVTASDGAAEVSDTSSANFTIQQAPPNQAPVVTLTSPDGGEAWTAGSTQAITYTATDPDSGPSALTISLDYSTNSGGTWTSIATGQANTGSYSWTVPAVTTTTARVRVTASDGADQTSDSSGANFSIAQNTNALALGNAAGPSGTGVTVTLSLENEDLVKGIQADITFDAARASFAGVAGTARTAGMIVEGEQIAAGQARIILYYDSASQLAPGSGEVATLTFNLTGSAGGSTALTLAEMILSGTEGNALAVTGTNGTLSVEAPQAVPGLQVAILNNPGRVRSLQIMVLVTNGSGNAPTVTAGGSTVTMSQVEPFVFAGTFSASESATSVEVSASDTNVQGTGTAQATVSFQ